MSIAKQSISSVTWNAISNGVMIPVGFIQSILLARLLPVEFFGIYGGVLALVTIIGQIFDLGLDNAFIHRAEETQDEEHALSVLFSLRFILSITRGIVLLLIAIILFSEARQLVLIVLTITGIFKSILSTPKVLLMRRIAFKRLAILNFTSAVLTAIASILIAWFTRSIWGLLASSIVTVIWMVIILYGWNPVWIPRFGWDRSIFHYYLTFGGRIQVTEFLRVALDNIDDLWTNIFLGDLALGFYSKAYKFATYPRTFLALPIQTVSTSTYAALKDDRKRLSQTFFRVNALLIRTGFLVSGWLVLIAPQFIRIFLGEQWLPMLDIFRLLVIFALLDPLKGIIGNLLVAVGKPQTLIRTRFIQLIVLILGLFILGNFFGIAGVGISADLMLVTGIVLLYIYTKPFVDFSLKRLFLGPLTSLVVSSIIVLLLTNRWWAGKSDWFLLICGSLVFVGLYLAGLLLIERKVLIESTTEIIQLSPWSAKFNKIFKYPR